MSAPEISLVIPSFRGVGNLRRGLPSLLEQSNVAYEVVVVENGADPATAAYLAELKAPHLRHVKLEPNQGFTGGVNAGYAVAAGRIVGILCNDNRADPDWLSRALAHYRALEAKLGPRFGALHAQSLTNSGGLHGSMNFFGRNVHTEERLKPDEVRETFYPGGNSVFLPRSLFTEPFFPEYFIYQEDVSLGFRVRLGGGRVFYYLDPRLDNFGDTEPRRPSPLVRFHTEKNRWLNILGTWEAGTIAALLPLLLADALLYLALAPARGSRLRAYAYLLFQSKEWRRVRAKFQAERRVRDAALFPALSPDYVEARGSKMRTALNSLVRAWLSLARRRPGSP